MSSSPSFAGVDGRQGKALERLEDHTPKLWMVHKTRNELVTRHDPEGRATVFDRLAKLKMPDTLMPVVRCAVYIYVCTAVLGLPRRA